MPEATSEQTQPKDAAPVLTDEMMAGFDKNPGTLAQAPKAVRDAVRARIAAPPADDAAGTGTGEGTPDAGTPPAAPVTDPAPAAAPAGEKPAESKEEGEKPESLEDKRARLRALDNEANTIEQRTAAAKRRLEKAKLEKEAFEKANPEKKPADFLEDSHQEDLAKKVRNLEAELASLRALVPDPNEEIETLSRSKAKTAEDRIASEIDVLMEDPKFAVAKLKKPFAKANSEWSGFLDNLVALAGITDDSLSGEEKQNPVMAKRQKALARYEEDAAFKQSVKVAPPEELDKLAYWLEAYNRQAKHGGTIRGHLFEILDDAGVLEKGFQRGQQDAARTAANRTVDAIRKQDEEITTIAPNDGASRPAGQDNELTPQSAAAFMALVRAKQAKVPPERLTDAEKKQLGKVREYIAQHR